MRQHYLSERRSVSWKGRSTLAVLAQPSDEGLIADSVLTGETHGALSTVVEGLQEILALLDRVTESTITAGADDCGIGRGIG